MIRHAVLLLALLFGTAEARAAAPDWVIAAAAAQVTSSDRAVVLVDDREITIAPDGRIRTVQRYAVRILDRAARESAAISETYLTGSGKVRELRGWVFRGRTQVRELGGRDAIDVALVNNDVYNEVRARSLQAVDEVIAGDLFAAEMETEDLMPFAQLELVLQSRWPAERVRRTLRLPRGWTFKALTFNGPHLEPKQEREAVVWEAGPVPGLPDEPAMPPVSDLARRIAVSVFGAPGSPAPGEFATWNAVAAWLAALSAPAATLTPELRKTAEQLTATATTPYDRARLVGQHAQRVQYVSIQTGIGRGGGYQPKPAALVLEKNYGDCKDKANLARTLLAALGIRSYLVAIYSGDRNYVREPWPSPQQFNHAIIAIAVPGGDGAGAAVEHPQLGRLVLFDPTDEFTPFGDLPQVLRGSLGLIVDASGGLIRVPDDSGRSSRLRRTLDARLAADGTLSATVREEREGEAAARMRTQQAVLGAAEFQRSAAARILARVPTGQLQEFTAPTGDAGTRVLTARFTAPAHPRVQGRLLLTAVPFDVSGIPGLPEQAARKTPVILEQMVIEETVDLQLPAGLVIDEMPEKVAIDSAVATYELTYERGDGGLRATRRLELKADRVETGDVPALVEFLRRVRAADANLVVLRTREPVAQPFRAAHAIRGADVWQP